MEKAVEQLQVANDRKLTKIIMVHTDLTEIGVLRSMFPDSRLLLCQFHVLKWLRGAVRDDKTYETYPSEKLNHMDYCLSNMVYSKYEDEFAQHTVEFKHLACRGNRDTRWTYFDKNWIVCKEILESFVGKLKADLDSSMSIRESLEATIRFQRRKEDEYSTRVIMPTTLRDITYDDEMNQILGMTSKLLAVVFEPEYKFAVDPTSAKSDSIEDEDLIFEHL
ncbi:hypothetical protein C6341_g24420 [Phytophthora cactorum]|nr:hypothetical protein C6341_g24420 [Phytophthora cactorum]